MTRTLALGALVTALLGGCGDSGSDTRDTTSVDTVTAADTVTAVDTAEADSAAPEDTAAAEDSAGTQDTEVVADTAGADADTSEVDAADVADDTVDPCAEVACAAPACPEAWQQVPAGECCPVCVSPTCGGAEDCTRCVWPTAPTSQADCYCTACPVALMTSEECAVNQAAWELHCSDWAPDPACPVPRCINAPAPICDAGACVEDPEACRSANDCVRCNHATPPASPDDCACPGCGVPTTTTWCEDVEAAVFAQCQGLLDDCLPPPCPAPPPLTCNLDTFRCELDFGAVR